MNATRLSTFNPLQSTGLVLEGGGMRGVFTCGVLDWLMDHEIWFPYTIGVSAGACNGLSYLSHQRGRAKFSNIDLMELHDFIGIRYLWHQHSILDQELLYGDLPETIHPFDFETYFNNPARFEMVTTNCVTGHACYLDERKDKERLIAIVKASSSLPYVCPITYVDGIPMLDGGIVDSIPVMRAISQGYKKNVVILTRDKSFRKSEKDLKVPRFVYKRYPRLRAVLSYRCRVYNQQLDLIDQMEEEGSVLVVRPKEPVKVSRIEKDVKKLNELYKKGYERAEEILCS